MSEITFVMIVKNAESTIKPTLEALKDWPHIVILDTGSTDKTIELINSYPHITLQKGPFEGFGAARNLATSYAKTSWVFHIDADEIPTGLLLKELSELKLENSFIYEVLRDNYFWNHHMKGCSGWYKDYVGRLYNKHKTKYSSDLVHEKVLDEGLKHKKLNHTLIHKPYKDLKAMIEKMNHYSDLFVNNTSKQVSIVSPFLHSFFAFFKSYFLKKGWTQGIQGFVISKYIADTAFYKYMKLYEKKYIKHK
jgi:glycosyltransferase involved in cell wall biosynthesis